MPRFDEQECFYMGRALLLARKVKGYTAPNPAVGAVIVKDGTIVGEGATAKCGGPHAEKKALRQAAHRAGGATLYVTLEPCCHFGRTPPCTDAIVAAGITKVVVAVRDPNPLVAGKGIRHLVRHGVEVKIGCMGKEAARINEDFMYAIIHQRAFVTLKLALTLDGYIADIRGYSKWISASSLRRIVHDLRRTHSAIAVGGGTLAADNPMLTVRSGRKANPARIVFTSGESIPETSYFYRHAHESRSIVVVRGTGEKRSLIDSSSGIEYWFTGESRHAKSMAVFTRMAYDNNCTSIFVEGGQKVASVLLAAGLVNRVYLFYGNKILGGGIAGISIGRGYGVDKCITLANREIVTVDNEFYLTGIPIPAA